MTPNTPILQEIHAELSLWQKIKLLAKVYWRYFYECAPIQIVILVFGAIGLWVIRLFGPYESFICVCNREFPTEAKLREHTVDCKAYNDRNKPPIALPSGVAITTARQDWNGQLVLELGGNLYEYCTDADLDRWYKYGLNPSEVARIVNQRQGVNDKPKKKKKSPKAAPITPNYYTGSVPQGSYYVDLRWDTVANGEVNYKDFWK